MAHVVERRPGPVAWRRRHRVVAAAMAVVALVAGAALLRGTAASDGDVTGAPAAGLRVDAPPATPATGRPARRPDRERAR